MRKLREIGPLFDSSKSKPLSLDSITEFVQKKMMKTASIKLQNTIWADLKQRL